ncbi:TIGR02594 family protein [Roseibium aggregatum]|uniref:TIGR02594 family protein n=1 Tax=Roseibium aggregatum TaxID=187304 RepID=A0A926P4A2_9HYPH|nr:TIGR02594 family protein [Roseibium aggregatum]MBD1547166.1 TIGR02594 family protein [Roseibium aggregatum]
MYYRAKTGTAVFLYRDLPSDPLTIEDKLNRIDLSPDLDLKSLSEDETKTWFKITALFPGGDEEGWVRAIDVDPADPPKPEDLDPWPFVKNCTLAARVINKANEQTGYGINRDFMIAYALVHTGTDTDSVPQNRVTGSGAEERHGPFALTVADWGKFLASDFNESGYRDRDIDVPVFQCYGFAYLVFEATKSLSEHFSTADTTKASGPWMPTTIELFLCLACGKDFTAAYIDKLKSTPDTKFTALLTEKAGADTAAALLERYKRFFGNGDLSIKDVDDKIYTAFDAALKRSFTLVRELTPEDLIYVVNDKLPWYRVAQEEFVKGVKETGTPPNPEVLKYFKATDYKTNREDPWCGAFVAWCLQQSNAEIAVKSVNKATAARAASWKTWGDVEVPIGAYEKSAVPVGAVVVLRPRSGTTDSSGHVGFFVEQNAKKIKLLGGNQSDSVKETEFDRRQVVAIRMLKGFDADPAQSNGPGTEDPNFDAGTLGPFTKADWAKYIDVLGHRESTNNYGAVNRLGYSGRWQFGALALIDGGYVKNGAETRLLAQDRWWTGKNGVTSRDAWLANTNACQDTEIIAFTRRNYRSLLNNRDSKKVLETIINTANKAALAGLLATAHLLGAGGARKMLKGQDGQDANGVKGRDYYALLAQAFGGSPTPPQI